MQELGTETKNEKKASRSGWWVILLNVAVIAAIAFLEFGRGERPQRIAMRELRPLFLLAALGCFLIMLLSETWKYARLLHATDHARPLHTGFRCAILGKYFDNITPAGFGGQPFQIHYLKTHGCSAGTSGALPILGFLGLQFSFIAVALMVFLFGGRVYLDLLTLRLAAWVGLACYSFVPVCVVLFAIAPKALARIVRGGTRLLHRTRIVKDPERSTKRAVEALESYTDSVRHFSSQPRLLVATAILSMVFRLAMVAMPWFVLRAFGAWVSFPRCFCQVTYIYAVIAMIPTPGNSGAAEASFYTVFSTLSTGSVFWAMLVWRLLCYYSWLIGGAAHYIAKTGLERRPYRPIPEAETPRCAVFSDAPFPYPGGAAAVREIAGERAGSAVICPAAEEKAKAEQPEVRLLRIPALRLPGLPCAVGLPMLGGRVKRELKKGAFTVFHACSPFTVGHYALRMGRRLGVPVVASFHRQTYSEAMRACGGKKRRKRALTRYMLRFYRQAGEVWAADDAAAKTLRRCGYEGEISIQRAATDAAYRRAAAAVAANPPARD